MFAHDAKEEVARVALERPCCARSFVLALLRCAAPRRAHMGRVLTSARGPVIRAALNVAHSAGFAATALTPSRLRPQQRRTVVLATPPAGHADAKFPLRSCCRRSWLRAAFLSCGSVSDPSRGYQLEFFCRDERMARDLASALALLDIDAGISRRRQRPVVYVKNAHDVSLLLAQLGAHSAVLQLEGQRALRQTKIAIRRAVNGEAANAARSAGVAARQHAAARRMLRGSGRARLSAAVTEAARLRIAHPDGTIAELATFARPPITKAAMASRLRLLERIAKR
ncbi:MAG: DNA-binding protein WhiA [Candidatus Eremiobacteraeota bacterium]|nr:DNA-binding protein WhiA [Candidatus Eremiobacteraeota bacterium]